MARTANPTRRSSRDRTRAPSRARVNEPSTAARDGADPRLALGLALAPIVIAWLITLFVTLVLPAEAHAISFDIEFRTTNQSVAGTETYDDLLLEHASGALLSVQTLAGVDGVSSVTLAGTNSNYSTLITTTFTAGVTGSYEFQVGTDWGLGGASQAVHVDSGNVIDTFITSNNLWWNNNWSDPDVFSTVLNLTAGETYSIGWVGFEDCCGGNVTFRFSVNGSPPATLDQTNFQPYEAPTPIPEPGTALLLGAGLCALGRRRVRA